MANMHSDISLSSDYSEFPYRPCKPQEIYEGDIDYDAMPESVPPDTKLPCGSVQSLLRDKLFELHSVMKWHPLEFSDRVESLEDMTALTLYASLLAVFPNGEIIEIKQLSSSVAAPDMS